MLDAIFAIPGMMLILGALVVPLLPPFVRNYYMLALIAFSGLVGLANRTGRAYDGQSGRY